MVQTAASRPRLLIAGTQSGVGKSTLSLALVAALKQRGLKVQTFKVGPDYLDPGHLSRVSGRPCYNLDGWMCERGYIEELFLAASVNADISLVEGVMGLFDGSSTDSLSGSSAEIAAWLQAPVLLVADVHGMARSFAALVKGYHELESQVGLAGVIANRCGSISHARLLSQTLQSAALPPLFGGVLRDSLPPLASRHLGLVSAAELKLQEQDIRLLAQAAEQQLDLDLLLKRARMAEPLSCHPRRSHAGTAAQEINLRLAVAQDEAFLFYYPDFFDLLEKLEVTLVFFSPLRDDKLPDNIAGLYLGGGYPEVHAQTLAANDSMLQAMRDFAASGKPLYAECGGLIYLSQGIKQEGRTFPLIGEIPIWAKMLPQRKTLGYVEVTLEQDSLFGESGAVFRGHEFHYSELTDSPAGIDGWKTVYRVKQNRTGNVSAEGYQRGNVLASYAHLHLASHPKAVKYFMQKMRQ